MKNKDKGKALNYFKKGFHCCQAVLSTIGEELGLNKELALKLSTGFGGGMASMGNTCGAVMGAFMVLGHIHGRFQEKDIESKEKTYSLIYKFAKKFIEINGSIECKNLLRCDISTLEGMELAKNKQLFSTLCPKFVEDAVLLLNMLL